MERNISYKYELLFRVHEDMEWQELEDNGKGIDFLKNYAKLYRTKGFDVSLSKIVITKDKTPLEF